jgi:hypothetical protein
MIAPDRGGSNGETSRRRLLRHNLLAALLIFIGLQIWRPYFFLTDDNLDGGFPFLSEVGRHLLAGRSPYFSDYLFGGHYDLLRDPTYFLWHPLYLLSSLLTATPLRFALIDVPAFGFVMLGAAGFVNLAWYLRRELALTISDGWIMFYTLSFSYSMIALTTGASWVNFLGAQSALPWLALGILQRAWWPSLGLITLFSVHEILGSHPEPTVSNEVFLSLFAAGVASWRRSWRPLLCWAAGSALALLILLPFLVPLAGGFFASARSHGVSALEMSRNNIPPEFFPTSILFGMALWIVNPPIDPSVTYTLAMGSAAAAWCSVGLITFSRKWTALEAALAGLIFLAILVVVRPLFVSEILVRLPLLKSMRWPFRELIQFQFFLHLLLVVRVPGFTRRKRFWLAAFSTAIFVVPLLAYRIPPTLNTMRTDRGLVLSGEFDGYWRRVRAFLSPEDRVAVLLPLQLYTDNHYDIPFSLLTAFNYPCLTRIAGAGGYSQTPPEDQLYLKIWTTYPFGAWRPEQKADLLAQRPDLKFITLESLSPLKITLSARTGPTVDLTPFVPAAVRKEVADAFARGQIYAAMEKARAARKNSFWP